MTDTEILSQLIHEQSKLQLETEYDTHHRVSLIEPDRSDSRIVIKNMPHDSFIIKSDKFPSPDQIFKGEKGECKRADYIIISEEKKCILFIEMKKTKDKGGMKVIEQQLKGAQCFLEYCKSVGKLFWKKTDFLHDYKMRFISFDHTGSIQKRKTQISREIGEKHDSAERAMKIAYASQIQFNTIAALGK